MAFRVSGLVTSKSGGCKVRSNFHCGLRLTASTFQSMEMRFRHSAPAAATKVLTFVKVWRQL